MFCKELHCHDNYILALLLAFECHLQYILPHHMQNQTAGTEFFSLSVIGPQRFIFSSCIISDHCIGCIQNITCGSIVLLQLDHLGIFKILLKIKDIFYIGAPEFVNGLIIITDYAEIPVLRCQKVLPIQTALYWYPDTHPP